MINDKILDIVKNFTVPRYTSYPTANHFGKISPKEYELALTNSNLKDFSVYIHIPFCRQLCWFCGCFKTITNNDKPIEQYLPSLLKEIRLNANLIKQSNPHINYLHFGGGSPTVLRKENFDLILKELNKNFVIDNFTSFSVEVDVRHLTKDIVNTYVRNKVTRVSLGIQDFNKSVQINVNRVQSVDLIKSKVSLLRDKGIKYLNFDMIYGLPTQSLDDIKRNIEYINYFRPSRISYYSYAHVPWFRKNMIMIQENQIPDFKLKHAMYNYISETLTKIGYKQIGIDHFVLKDDPLAIAFNANKVTRNFQGYTEDVNPDNLLGFGASSISKIGKLYAQNIADITKYNKYLANGVNPKFRGIHMQTNDVVRSYVIQQLMCYGSVNLAKVIVKFDLDTNFFKEDITAIKRLKEKIDIFDYKDYTLIVPCSNFSLLRMVASVFDSYYQGLQSYLNNSNNKIDSKLHSSLI